METLPAYDNEGYEYQYDERETETFLVDLDLSSVNPTAMPSNSRKAVNKSSHQNQNGHATRDPIEIHEGPSGEDEPGPGPAGNMEKMHRGRGRPKHPVKSLQMLDLGIANPIVAYNDQVYDCSWTDMVGTNMFFDMPSGTSSTRSWLSGKDLTLTGTSRIKLVGHRAKLSKADSQKRKHGEMGEDPSTDGRGLPGFKSGNAQNNIDTKKQADFLERLMDAKKRRDEKDLVTVIPASTNGQHPNAATSEVSRDKIDALNRRIVRGDIDALSELQAISSRVNSFPDEPVSIPKERPIAGTEVQSPKSGVAGQGEDPSDHG